MKNLLEDIGTPSECVSFYTNMALSEDIALEAAQWPA